MEGWLPCLLFATFLLLCSSLKYRLPGLLASIFLAAACISIYNLFMLGGLTFNRSTFFGALWLLMFAQMNSFNLLKWIRRYLLSKSYTTRMAIYLANKKNNTYIYELALLLLIPGALFVFLLPSTLKELGLVIVLGSVAVLAFWFLFSNFYFPHLLASLEQRKNLLLSYKAQMSSSAIPLLEGELGHNIVSAPLEMPKKIVPKAPEFAPIIFALGAIGLILWLSKYELNYPNFFKNNKLLSINSNSKSAIETDIKDLVKKELKNLPEARGRSQGVGTNFLYYLFPESIDLANIINKLDPSKQQQQGGQHLDWSLQTTEAFSTMPVLIKTLRIMFWSLAPLSAYTAFRFGISSAISLISSSLIFIGTSFLFLLATTLQMPELLPEVVLVSFIALLSYWTNALVAAKEINTSVPESVKNKGLRFKMQANQLKVSLRTENWLFFASLACAFTLYLSCSKPEIVYALLLVLVFKLFIFMFFIPLHTFCWSRLNLFFDRYYYHLVKFFVKSKEKETEELVEEESVLGINV
ncbi:membrane protein [Candidatus Mycoplasma haematolamae str. Purdue]|uniref:Membrane protein n=1 Tax=Mycoplasma haematolamae (strain Purdue) TaxID=1212765 RepID=I7C735_MYCHA|nr:hypothetical protein [Candidatus Mycoplasma haematolamae]AFO52372.1 membrane protein [Candidatus Mycoplasma haematolamae str. Purdue]